MAKTSSVVKQKRRERLVNLKWDRRQELKTKIRDLQISEEDRHQAIIDLNKLPKTPPRLACATVASLPAEGVEFIANSDFSRLCFREMASKGLIPRV